MLHLRPKWLTKTFRHHISHSCSHLVKPRTRPVPWRIPRSVWLHLSFSGTCDFQGNRPKVASKPEIFLASQGRRSQDAPFLPISAINATLYRSITPGMAADPRMARRVGEKLSPTAQTIFAGMYITHALPMAVWCTLRHAVAGCEFTSKLGLS